MNSRTAAEFTSPTRLVLMLTIGMFLNFVNRGNLATSAPLLQADLKLSATQLGVLLGVFYYGYATCMIPAGAIAERYGAKRLLAFGALIWSLTTLSIGITSVFGIILALRLLLGIGESVAFPCTSKIFATAVPVNRLGIANGVFSFGYLIGPAAGTLLGGYVMHLYGWRPVFLISGSTSLIWLWFWSRVSLKAPERLPAKQQAYSPSFGQLLRQRALWGACLGNFASNYGYGFFLAWLPLYLVKSRGMSIGSMATLASWAYLLNACGALLMGWAADRWVAAGRNADVVYKGTLGLANLAGIACMAGMVLLPTNYVVPCLLALQLIWGLSYPGIFAVPQIMAGPQAAARWVAVQNGVGNVAGLVQPILTGVLVDRTGRFDVSFWFVSAVSALGFVGWIFLVPSVKAIKWRRSEPD